MHEYISALQEIRAGEPTTANKIQAVFLGETHIDPETELVGEGETEITPQVGEQLRRQALEFREYLQRHERLVIAHHIDADGITSTVLLFHYLSELMGIGLQELFYNRVTLLSINNGLRNFDDSQMETLTELSNAGYTGVLFSDLSPRDGDQLNALRAMGYEIGNVDHHMLKDSTPDVDVRFNPAAIPNIPPDFVTQLSTSVLVLPNIRDEKQLRWIAALGNFGDESFTMASEMPAELFGQYSDLARKLNLIGATEQYGIDTKQRDLFMRNIFEAFLFTFNVMLSEGFEATKKLFDTMPIFKERFNSIGKSIADTQLFLLETVTLSKENRAKRNAEEQLELLTIENDEGQKSLVIEGANFRVIYHVIDSKNTTNGNIIVGNMIKRHQNALKWLADQDSSEKAKPTTVLLAQQKSDETTEFGLYTIDPSVQYSQEMSCDALMEWLKQTFDHGSGGGHKDRAGGDIDNDHVAEASWEIIMKLLAHLSQSGGAEIPAEILQLNGPQFLTTFFRPETQPNPFPQPVNTEMVH